ncbi:MAG TPA: hypothetical protein PLF61_00125, partial [Candidatus Goldiibacteriota bacterium]|nr:hypothetical protein [Candidatus Goldiibacteriota bacterium]
MELYIVVGGSNTRKSSLIRALTGVGKMKNHQPYIIFQQSFPNPPNPCKIKTILIFVNALQENNISPQDFIKILQGHKDIDKVLFALRINNRKYDDTNANKYIDSLNQNNFKIDGIAILGNCNDVNIKYFQDLTQNFYHHPNSTNTPTNE